MGNYACAFRKSELGKYFESIIIVLNGIQFQFQSHCHSSGWGGGGRLFEFNWEGERWDGRLIEAGRLLTFSAFRMGAYWRWALIRGWAII